MRGALQKTRKGFGSVGARCRPQLFPKEQFPFAEPEGCHRAHARCLATPGAARDRHDVPPAGTGCRYLSVTPGDQWEGERDRLLRPLPRAEDTEGLAPAVATFANLQIVFFARAWPELSARLEP